VVRGNPALKPATNYLLGLQYGWRKGIVDINFLTSYRYVDKMIMKELHREDGLFISVFNNQRNFRKLNSELSFNIGPVNDIIQLSLTGGINRYRSKGHNYDHKHTNFYYRVQVIGMYKKFSAVFNIYSPYDNLLGELLYRGENNHNFMLNYNQGKFTVGAGIMYPFSTKYKRVSEVWNIYTPLKTDGYINDFSRMILLRFSWNFNYGRKAKTIDRRLNNSDTDSGIMRAN